MSIFDIESIEVSSFDIHILKVDPEGISPFLEEIQRVTSSGFGAGESIKMTVEDFKEGNEIVLFFINGVLIGFLSTRLLNNVTCINIVALEKEYHGIGIFSCINRVFFAKTTDLILKTQNMSIIKAYRKLGREVSVGKEALEISLQKLKSTENIAKLVGGNSKQPIDDNGIFRGAFGGYLGVDQNVVRITDCDYPGFNADKGDASLVYIK